EDLLHLAQQVATEPEAGGAGAVAPVRHVEQRVAHLRDVADEDTRAEDPLRQAGRPVLLEQDALPRVARRLRVGDIVRDDLDRRLVRVDGAPGDAQYAAEGGHEGLLDPSVDQQTATARVRLWRG